MRKKILASLLVLCMALAMFPVTALAAFDDTAGHWSASSVERWADAGILSGDGSGSFNPDKEMTRAEFAQMLCGLMGYTEKAPNTFSDVPDDAWYADAILKLNAAGVMSGVGDGMAAPNDPITREQAAVLLCRAMNIKPSQDASVSFSDAGSVSGWAKDAVAALTERGMINGVGDNTFAPALNINRASVAKMVDNMVSDYVTENGATITGEVKGVVIIKADGVKIENATLTEPVVVAPAAANATVSLTGTTSAADVVVAAEGAKVVVGKDATAAAVSVEAPKAQAEVSGKVDTVAVAENAEGAKATVAKDAEIKNLTVAAPNAETEVSGKIENVSVAETASNAEVKTTSSAQVGTVTTEAEGTKVSGTGKVDTVTATGNADNTSVTTTGTKTENKTESGSMTDGKGNETKPGDTGTSSSGSSSSSGGGSSSSGGGSGTTTPTHTHTWGDWTVTKPATCTETGLRTRTCTAEGCTDPAATETEEIPATGHTYTKGTVIMADETNHMKICDTCGDSSETEAHDIDSETKTCACGYKPEFITDDGDSCGNHTWAPEGEVTEPATCTDPGTEVYKCTKKAVNEKGEETEENCAATKTVSIPALGHKLVDDDDKNYAPTCNKEGQQGYKKCTNDGCDYVVKGTTVPATGNHAAAPDAVWEKDNTKHWHVCATEGCDAKVDEADHVWTKAIGECDICGIGCPNAANHGNIATTEKCPTCGVAGTNEDGSTSYNITVAKTENGEVTTNPVNAAAKGTKVTIIVTPATGYELDKLTVTDAKDGIVTVDVTTGENSFIMPDSDVTVTATFKEEGTAEDKYTVTINKNNDVGTVEAKVGNEVVPTDGVAAGTEVTITVTPNRGYELTAVTVGNSSGTIECTEKEDGTFTFTMPASNVTVTVEFDAKMYSVKVSEANKDDKITVALTSMPNSVVEQTTFGSSLKVDIPGSKTVESVTYTMEGTNEPVEVKADEDGNYTFKMPDGDITVTVKFKDDSSSGGGTTDPSTPEP